MLNGEVGDAAASIAAAVAVEGGVRTCPNACSTLLACCSHCCCVHGCGFATHGRRLARASRGIWYIRRHCDGPEELGEEEVGAGAGDDEVVVESDEADAGLLRPVAFAHGGGVDQSAIFAAVLRCEPVAKLREAVLEHVMVVCAEGVGGDVWVAHAGIVIEGAGDDRLRAREQQARIVAHIAVTRAVVHRAVLTICNPLGINAPLRLSHHISDGEAAAICAQLQGTSADEFLVGGAGHGYISMGRNS